MDNNTTEQVETNANDIDKGAYILDFNTFTGSVAGGFSFYNITYKNGTDEECKASIEHMLSRWTAKSLIGLVNSSVKSSLRVKAQNSLPKYDDSVKQLNERNALKEKNPVLLSPEDADSFVPGAREQGIQGMMRDVSKLMKEGKVKEALELLQLAQIEMAKQMQEQTAEA